MNEAEVPGPPGSASARHAVPPRGHHDGMGGHFVAWKGADVPVDGCEIHLCEVRDTRSFEQGRQRRPRRCQS